MAVCAGCKNQFSDGAKYCPSCGRPNVPEGMTLSVPLPTPIPAASPAASDGSDPTMTSWGNQPPPPTSRSGASGSGHDTPARPAPSFQPDPRSIGATAHAPAPGRAASLLNSSTGTSEGRFQTGDLLGDRFRIIGQLGKGGMGEVFRADDLKLMQPVALKFLPPHLSTNRVSLDRMINEVRVARAVSHPNVCRVHDIGEVDDLHYISMEYVDGEDLASLLRRVGRFPQERAVQVARQLCAGLAAAHAKGVLHRDLKPANVMIDGTGTVKVTDFGLAGLAQELAGKGGRAGTPAYMAPEQFSGSGVSPKSDIYALGLVLYETFTGKPVYRPESLEHLAKLHTQPPPSVSSVVSDVDPRIERVILRCLERDPDRRPSSALAVAAALAGGDAMADVLAAGETPTPEMVAASGERGSLRPPLAMAALVLVAVGALLIALLGQKTRLLAHATADRSREELSVKAQDILADVLRPSTRLDRAIGFIEHPEAITDQSSEAAEGIAQNSTQPPADAAKPAPVAASPAPSSSTDAVEFWFRESAVPMAPRDATRGVQLDDPPLSTPGMSRVRLDMNGRLREVIVVPEAGALQDAATLAATPTSSPAAPTAETVPALPPIDWKPLYKNADLDESTIQPATPALIPPVYCDARFAWTCKDRSGRLFRCEAGAVGARPVYFSVMDQGAPPAEASAASGDAGAGGAILFVLFLLAAVGGPGWIAWNNIKRGRGDRKGAITLAGVTFAASLLQAALGAHHTTDLSIILVWSMSALGVALLKAALIWVGFVAIEPIVRRQRPESIISWARLVGGNWRDPLVGRDILIGTAVGVLWMLVAGGYALAIAASASRPPHPQPVAVESLVGFRQALGVMLNVVFYSLIFPLFITLIQAIVRKFVKEPAISRIVEAGALTLVIAALMSQAAGGEANLPLALVGGVGCMLIGARFGLLMLVSAFFAVGVISAFPIALGLSSWATMTGVLGVVVIAAAAVFGFVISITGLRAMPRADY
ncbi:MAG: protein kinase [Phycisphaerae bacterium]|nr:protein kinase [Phycisphaerae bacterium]